MGVESGKKPILLVVSGIVVTTVFMLGSMVYQTSQHEAYVQKAISEFNSQVSMQLDLDLFESGLFSSTAITSLTLFQDRNPTLRLEHHLKSSPFFKTKITSTLDPRGPSTLDDIDNSALAQKIKTVEIVSEVSYSGVKIETGFNSLPLGDDGNFCADGISAEAVITPQGSSEKDEQYQAQTTLKVDRISGEEGSAKFLLENGVFTSSSLFNDEILNSSSIGGEIESISIIDAVTDNYVRISEIDMFQETKVSALTDTLFEMGIKKVEIKHSVIDDINIKTSLKSLDSASLKLFFTYLREQTALQDFKDLSKFMEAGVGILSKNPTFAVDSMKASVNGADVQLHGSLRVNNFVEFLLYGFTQGSVQNINLRANITADKNIYASLAKLDFALNRIEEIDPQNPTEAHIQQRATMFKVFVEQNQLFQETDAGISADIEIVNGAGYVNGQRMM
ncbi:MAG: DUF945 family protein [Desulfuromonadaceae bacterium]|nr:DUF945 family protein [Desulfuromonadaceae bacterium]